MNDPNSDSAADTAAAQTLPPSAQVVQMAGGFVISRAIFAVAELGIADYLKDASRSSDEIAKATNTHAPSIYRLLRFMAGLGFFVEDSDKRLFNALRSGIAIRRSRIYSFDGSDVGWLSAVESVERISPFG